MPQEKLRVVVLFTWHAYGTWMPDRPQGYFKNKTGLWAADSQAAIAYRHRQQANTCVFCDEAQQLLVVAAQEAASHQGFSSITLATDRTHVHLLAGWVDEREPNVVRTRVKQSLTRQLNARFGNRQWFTRGGHDRLVRDGEHFHRLRHEYLPSHRGWFWDRTTGVRPPCEPEQDEPRS